MGSGVGHGMSDEVWVGSGSDAYHELLTNALTLLQIPLHDCTAHSRLPHHLTNSPCPLPSPPFRGGLRGVPLRASCRDGAGRQTSPGATARTEAAEEGAGVVRVVGGRQPGAARGEL